MYTYATLYIQQKELLKLEGNKLYNYDNIKSLKVCLLKENVSGTKKQLDIKTF